MDTISVVSSASINRSIDFPPRPSQGGSMVQKKWASKDGRRASYDVSQRSEVSTGTDLSNERPSTRDTACLLVRDASVLSGKPDKSNFREKMQSWAVYEDSSSPYLAPRPTTSLADQKPAGSMHLKDVEREMTFLMSRPSTTFPSKPKELVEPLDGLLPDERPVSQKKFFVLPSIGHAHPGDLLLRRQRSNLETVNQLDYCRSQLEEGVHFFSEYYQSDRESPAKASNKHGNRRHNLASQQQHQSGQYGNHHHHHQQQSVYDDSEDNDDSDVIHDEPPLFMRDPRESPTKCGKIGTPMPLPPIHKLKWEKIKARAGLSELTEENAFAIFSRGESRLSGTYSEEDEEDIEDFRLKTPETYRTDSPTKPVTYTPPPGFR